MDLPLTLQAMILASEEHAGHVLGDGTPMILHLQMTGLLAMERADDLSPTAKKILLAAAFLHHIKAVVPDLTHAELTMEFGEEAADTIDALTRRKGERKWDHQRRLEKEPLAAMVHHCCQSDLEAQ